MDLSGKDCKEINNKMISTMQSKGNDACIYYGINIPINLICDEDIEKVFTDKNKCLLLLKQFPGSRFKCFKTFEEAETFSNFGSITLPACDERQNKISDIISAEKSSPFRGPKSQDLVKFRKSIENGNIEYFSKCVKENPRYLVSSGDTPAILQEGSRYNALHIACKFDRAEFCNKILSTISVADFFQRLYPDDHLSSSERRSAFLLDLYLNTPDKGLNETPLHFACKFGSFDCIKLLTSYSTCDKIRPNKYNETPKEIICTRVKTKDEKLIDKIKELFEEHCYVPVLRDEESCLSPLIAPPWSLLDIKNLPSPALLSPSDEGNSPVGPTRKVSGYAGPMSPQKANSFYSRWKRSSVPSPLRGTKGKLAALRIKDLEKGVERVGRNLAAEFDVDWVEYWNFLGNFTNLSTSVGLQSLENHLKLQFRAVIEKPSREIDEDIKNLAADDSQLSEYEISHSLASEGLKYFDETNSSLSSIGGLCEDLEALRLNVSLSPREESKRNVKIKTCSSLKRKLSNSVSIPSSKKPVMFQNKEKEELPNEVNSNYGNSSSCDLNISEYSENKLEDSLIEDDYNSFAIQSTRISARRIACILVEVSRTISYHIGPDFQIARILRNKIKPELQSLRKILSKWECVLPEKKVDLGFVHIFLAATTIEQVMENVSTSNLYLISESLKLLILNMHSLHDSSSDEDEDVESSPKVLECSEFNAHFSCVVNKLDTAILLGIELLKEGKEEKINLSKFDDCYCNWNDQFFKVENPSSIRYQSVDTKQINESINNQSCKKSKKRSRFLKAHSLLGRFLFGKSFEEEEENKNISVVTPVFNTSSNIQNIDISKSDQNVEEDDKESEDNESFASAVSSFESEETLVTPEQEIKFFINGTEPSKNDFDAFVALEGLDIDGKMFPFVFRWMSLIESFTFQEKEQWPSTTRKQKFKPATLSSKKMEGGARKQLIL